MLKVFRTRLRQGYRTMRFPDAPPPALPARFRGRPEIDPALCPAGCGLCAEACPTGAICVRAAGGVGPQIDLGRCLFCTECLDACPAGALSFTGDHRLAVRERGDLILGKDELHLGEGEMRLAAAMGAGIRRVLGRSLKLRVVSAGGCNGCEGDTNVLTTIGWDIGRFGIQYVASPRHADGLIVTGPVTANMVLALRKTYDAVPAPKVVVAIGACAISGGPFVGMPDHAGGAGAVLPVDLYIPGCPPHPLTILDGLLRFIGRIEMNGRKRGSPS